MKNKIEAVLGFVAAICVAVIVWNIVPWLCIGCAASLIVIGIASGIKHALKQTKNENTTH